jgi:hypothetical protein
MGVVAYLLTRTNERLSPGIEPPPTPQEGKNGKTNDRTVIRRKTNAHRWRTTQMDERRKNDAQPS